MAYQYVVQDYFVSGMPQTVFYGGAGPFRGISCHWTAGGPGRQGALGTVNFLVNNAGRNASYHEIWYWENKTFGVLRIVPPQNASHSMNPAPPDWSPNANVRRILGDRVYNPNRYSYSVSFAGMPYDMDVALSDPDFVDAATQRTLELFVQFESSLTFSPLYNHGEGQPSTRYDWGQGLTPAIYARMNETQPEPEEEVVEEPEVDLSLAKHQIPKIVRIREGATLYKTYNGDQVHWTVPAGQAFDAELLFGMGTRWFGRRLGSNGAFFFGQEAIDPNVIYKLANYNGVDQTAAIAALKTDLAAANQRLALKNAKADELKAV